MPAEIRVFAKTVPAISLVLGFILILIGTSNNNEVMATSGWTFVIVGVVLQIFWLFRRRLSDAI